MRLASTILGLRVAHDDNSASKINRAEKWVKREASEEDRRLVYVCLTKRGGAILETLSTAHREELRRVGPEIRELLARLSGEE